MMTHHDHDHDHSIDGEAHGIALGFRVFEHQGEIFFAEAEVSAYVDEPTALGATLVFHRVSGTDPTAAAEQIDWPTWAIEIDDELTRDEGGPIAGQFDAILRQLAGLDDARVRDYLERAMQEAEDDDEEE